MVSLSKHRGRRVKYGDLVPTAGERYRLMARAAADISDPGRRRREMLLELAADQGVADQAS